MNHTFYGVASITGANRSELIGRDNMPGPGTYDPTKQDHDRIPQWTLKPKIQYTSCFHNRNPIVPAPGTYNIEPSVPTVDSKASKEKSPKNMRYKEKTSIEKSSPVIVLQIPSFVDEHKGHSFGYRDEIVVHETSPGPVYNVNELLDENKRKKIINSSKGFGYGERIKIEKEQNPGPGNYQPIPQKLYGTSGKWTFAKSQRKDKTQGDNPTSPGQYNPKMIETCRTFKIKGRHPQTKSQFLDLPHSYNLPDTKTKKGAIFSKISVEKLKNKQTSETPSPFSYNIGCSTKPGGFSLGRKIETSYQSDSPGPGTYDNNATLFEKCGGFISKKQSHRKKISDQTDNFYKYSPKLDYVSYKYPQFTFKHSRVSDGGASPMLGPGSYLVEKMGTGESYSMGKDIRFKPLVKESSGIALKRQNSNQHLTGFVPWYLKAQKASNTSTNSSNKQNKSRQTTS